MAAALKYKVDRHSIRDWKKKKNESQELSKSVSNKKTKRLQGGGTKTMSEEMEERVLEWIVERRSKMLRLSRKLIRKKAIIVYGELNPDRYGEKFEATNVWLFKFMKRHNSSLRRKTIVAQNDPPDLLKAKMVSYILRVRRLRMKYSYQPASQHSMKPLFRQIWFQIQQ